MAVGHFAGNFLTAFSQARAVREAKEDTKKERDAKMKLFELQLKREQAAQAASEEQQRARAELFGKLRGTAGINPGAPIPQGAPEGPVPLPPGAQQKPLSLTELLADPQAAMLFLQSGLLKPEDLLTQESKASNRAMVERLMGGGTAGGMQLTGVKIGPDGQMMPDFGLPQVTSPQTIDTPEGPRLQTFDPRSGRMVADLGAAKADPITPQEAGRLAAFKQGVDLAPQIKNLYINSDGSVNRKNIFNAFAGTPFTSGRLVDAMLGDAIDGLFRARTGSAAPEGERKNIISQFKPSPLDNDETVKDKLGRLEKFLTGSLDVVTLSPNVRAMLDNKGKSGGGKVIDFNELPD